MDNSEGDDKVLDMFLEPEKKKKEEAKVTYPWTLDEDVLSTHASLNTSETMTGKKLSAEAVRNGGLDMIFHYDNTKRQNERPMNIWAI